MSFRYPGTDQPALDGITLHVTPGETVALVGATGAGKSTLVKLVARFYDPTSGAVRVDGVDLRDYDLAARTATGWASCRRRRTCSPATWPSNVAYGDGRATDARHGHRRRRHRAEVEAAVRAVGALPMVADLPDGFRHQVGERGQSLSAGQRQLIALARAELVDPDVLLLDEATAALDPATESVVLAASDTWSSRAPRSWWPTA